MPLPNIYEQGFLRDLFNQMGNSYARVADICSLGFSQLWRQQAVKFLDLKEGDNAFDLMAGTGESWKYMLPKVGESGRIYALDFSHEMCLQAKERKNLLQADNVHVLEGDAFSTPVPDGSMDAVFSAYGVKTMPISSYDGFVSEVNRVLKPGGQASIMEVSLPENKAHQLVFKAFLNAGFPVLKKLLGHQANHFSMFRHYLSEFQNCKRLREAFNAQGFETRYVRLPGDGATAIVARKLTPG
jgi:demethylmenaquinone methyltransferase / 2-methoxy-6-polyprenyl-1,4-benzoquinol methylase